MSSARGSTGFANNSESLGAVQMIALGGYDTCVLTTAGDIRCWGSNDSGQIGDGWLGEEWLLAPPERDVLAGVAAVAAGNQKTCALMTSGGVRCWGGRDRS